MPRFEVHKAPRTIVDLLYPPEETVYGSRFYVEVVHKELRKSLNVQICIPAAKGKYAEWMVFNDLGQKAEVYGIGPSVQWREDWFISVSYTHLM